MEVAHYWHVWPPSRFYEASKEDQAIAAEFYREKMAIQAYQQELDAQESKRKIKGDAIDLLGDEPADG